MSRNRSVRNTFAGLVVLLVATGTARAGGRIFEVSYEPSTKPGELVYGVTYRVWIPEKVDRLRGVIVHQHGCGKGACQGGETAADDLHWQALAAKWDCALLGPSFKQEDGQNCRLWCDPRNGSRARFLQALDDLAAKSNHPELAKVPWCLWGHSGGGFWASLMQVSDPNRIVAIWLRSGTGFVPWEKGEIPRPEIPEAAYGIPVMANPGAKENGDTRFKGAWDGTLAMFKAYRAKGAPFGFAPDPNTAHECGDSRYLAIRYFDACLTARLPDKGAGPDSSLRTMNPDSGWLAPVLGDKPVAAKDYKGDAKEAVWLPGEAFAQAWAEYVKTGGVEDTTPPPAPANVTVTREPDGSVAVSWDAAADLESGIQGFAILRGGQEVGKVPNKAEGRFGRPLFQGLSYHDTPNKPLPAMRFIDKEAGTGTLPAYEVVTVNTRGLRSAPARSK